MVSNQNSSKNKDLKVLERPRTFGEQLKSFARENSEDFQSVGGFPGFNQGRQPFARDRLSECTRTRRDQRADIDEEDENRPRVASPDFPARQLLEDNSDKKTPSQQDLANGMEDDIMHQFTFKDQNSSPFKYMPAADQQAAGQSEHASTDHSRRLPSPRRHRERPAKSPLDEQRHAS